MIREAGGDRSAVTGGTTVLSDCIKVRVTSAARLDLHRSHDRPGRRRRPPQNAEQKSLWPCCWPVMTLIFLIAVK